MDCVKYVLKYWTRLIQPLTKFKISSKTKKNLLDIIFISIKIFTIRLDTGLSVNFLIKTMEIKSIDFAYLQCKTLILESQVPMFLVRLNTIYENRLKGILKYV